MQQRHLISISSLLVFIFVSAFRPLPVEALSKKYAQRADRKLRVSSVTEELQGCSKQQCVAGCTANSSCKTVSWSSSQRRCLMSPHDVALSWGVQNSGHKKLEMNTGWSTYAEIFYPVAHFYEGRYSFSFADASQACINHGTQLATADHMLAARAQGLDYCSWGWLANGRIGMVRQRRHSSCTSFFSTGVMYSSRKSANAWCLLH